MTGRLPSVISHADWGVHPRKRWRAIARLGTDGQFKADGPDPVGATGSILDRMGAILAPEETALLGFDFPIGLPRAYAELAALDDFRSALLGFGSGEWVTFFDVADSPEEISLYRPFFPRTMGVKGQHTRKALLDALRLTSAELLRRCDRASSDRRVANPLFWTLGGAQVGKGALSGWRELLVPALADPNLDVAIWPFDGLLTELLNERRVVVSETYPAGFYKPLGVKFGPGGEGGKWGKRRQGDRRAQAAALLASTGAMKVHLVDRLEEEIRDGFGDKPDGEDRFDAVAGLLGMLGVILERWPEGLPDDDPAVFTVEGWMLGHLNG